MKLKEFNAFPRYELAQVLQTTTGPDSGLCQLGAATQVEFTQRMTLACTSRSGPKQLGDQDEGLFPPDMICLKQRKQKRTQLATGLILGAHRPMAVGMANWTKLFAENRDELH